MKQAKAKTKARSGRHLNAEEALAVQLYAAGEREAQLRAELARREQECAILRARVAELDHGVGLGAIGERNRDLAQRYKIPVDFKAERGADGAWVLKTPTDGPQAPPPAPDAPAPSKNGT